MFIHNASRILIQSRLAHVLLIVGMSACMGSSALAQLGKKNKTPSTPNTAPKPGQPNGAPPVAGGVMPKSILDDVIKKGRTHDWVFKVSIHLDSYQDPAVYTLRPADPNAPRVPRDGTSPTIVPFKFDTAAVVFPTLAGTATSMLTGQATATLLFDGKNVGSEGTIIDRLDSGARYSRWDMKDNSGRAIDVDIEMPVTTWESVFDEQKASKAIWPASGHWPRECATSFGATYLDKLPIIDPTSVVVREALAKWTSNKPPQSIPPVQLAKFLASKMLETIQPSGDGLISSRTGLLQGFDLHGAEYTLKEGRGSEHDIACTLCSIYRAAGLPARTVIGFDLTESKGSGVGLKHKPGGAVRSWVEFALIDETAVSPTTGEPKVVWVPVDVVRQRKGSSVAPPEGKPWKYFGFNPDAEDVIPIAFHYHPPLSGVVAHGSPCFWGWMTTPEMQQAEQTIRFQANTATRTIPPGGGGGGYK